jgi:hypothetical protein
MTADETAPPPRHHRHATPAKPIQRHAALCQEVMVHQHWVQHCR